MNTSIPAILTFVIGLLVGSALHPSASGQSQEQGDPAGATGIGGVFFKAENPARLRAWYREHLAIDGGDSPGVNFFWRDGDDPARFGRTVWSVFPDDTTYFGDTQQRCMINYRVGDLDALLARLRAQGVEQVGEVEDYWYGRFAWIEDDEGNRVELWEPVDQSPEEFDERLRREEGR